MASFFLNQSCPQEAALDVVCSVNIENPVGARESSLRYNGPPIDHDHLTIQRTGTLRYGLHHYLLVYLLYELLEGSDSLLMHL